MKEIVALIPVKTSSDRVENKNTRTFHDTNLFELKLRQLSYVDGFANKIVSSESQRLLEIAKAYDFDIHHRNPKYSTSSIPMSEVYSHIAAEIKGKHIAWINVTNPLAESVVYKEAIQTYESLDTDYDCLLSAYDVNDYLFYENKPINFKPNPWPKSQDLRGVIALSFVINILRREDMVRWGSCVGQNPYFYKLDPVTSIDIDYPWDFEFCEIIYRKRLIGK